MIDLIKTDDDAVRCLVAAVRIQCRNLDEAEKILSKATAPRSESWPKELQDRLSQIPQEERWASIASNLDKWKDELFDFQLSEKFKKKLTKVDKTLFDRETKIEVKDISKYIKFATVEYLIMPENEALKVWGDVDLALAQHKFEQWYTLTEEEESPYVKQAVSSLRECANIARHLEISSGGDTEEKFSPRDEPVQNLQSTLEQYPFPRTSEEQKLWIRVGEVAAIEKTVKSATLRKYRDAKPAQKTPDGLAGSDKDGRIWRKSGPNKQILYLISSLKNMRK